MPIEEILDQLDELIDRSWSLPLTGGRCVVDADKVRELLDDVRLNLPTEIRQAQSIVADRTAIVEEAKKEAEAIIARAEKRAAALVEEQEIVRQSKNKAAEITQQAQQQSREMRQSAKEFVDGILKNTEETLAASLTEVKGTRSAFNQQQKVAQATMQPAQK
ncbi:MAG: ATPase [Ruminococcaceae bacterium]|nr:ATPase [Oscillospiraceae bacterium]